MFSTQIKRNLNIFAFLTLIILYTSSCTITKRRYRKGVYIQNGEQAKTETNPLEKTETKKDSTSKFTKFEESDIKDHDSKIIISTGLGIAKPLAMPLTLDLNYKGFGIFYDLFLFSKTKYYALGGYYDILKNNSKNSIKLGASMHFNFRTSYEYLFKYKNSNLYVGACMFFVRPDFIKSLKEDPSADLKSIPDEKYLTKSGWFITSSIYIGIKFHYH